MFCFSYRYTVCDHFVSCLVRQLWQPVSKQRIGLYRFSPVRSRAGSLCAVKQASPFLAVVLSVAGLVTGAQLLHYFFVDGRYRLRCRAGTALLVGCTGWSRFAARLFLSHGSIISISNMVYENY
jgi:hypothetical protein